MEVLKQLEVIKSKLGHMSNHIYDCIPMLMYMKGAGVDYSSPVSLPTEEICPFTGDNNISCSECIFSLGNYNLKNTLEREAKLIKTFKLLEGEGE